VSGALIGLLFVAISVVGDRLTRIGAATQVHRIRAYAALVSFVNTLSVSLFALIPDHLGGAVIAVSLVGLAFVVAALLSLSRVRPRRWITVRDAVFLVGLAVVFVLQLISGLQVETQANDAGTVDTIAILVVVCFLLGIARAWELIGGPSIGIRQEIVSLARHEQLVDSEAETGTAQQQGRAQEAQGPTANDARPPG